jgi:hypothetical protein
MYHSNILKWQDYLVHHNYGGTMWTEFLKVNRKKQLETYDEYRKRITLDYAKSKNIDIPLIGKFDEIIKRLDTIILKMNNTSFIPPSIPIAPPMNLPPMPKQQREQEKEILTINKIKKSGEDTNEPLQVRLLNELKKKLEERRINNEGSGIDITHNPLSSDEIQKKIGCKFILYENMDDVKDINQLLPMTLILYQLAEIGHFCCVFENEEGINFFDPLGYAPDDELKMAGGYAPDHDFTYLVQLLENSDKPIVYNEHKLQSHKTSTCGHWCSVRMICRGILCDDFAKCFKNVKDRDETIVKIYNSL